MASELQRLVDSLGSRLNRSVAIDDPAVRLLAYNAHDGEVDGVRIGSLLRRAVSPEVVEYAYGLGIREAQDLFTMPARPEIGLQVTRIAMPIRYEDTLLGFLWLLLSDGPVTEEQAAAVRQAAAGAAVILHREYLLGELVRGRERELVRDLLAGDEAVRTDAATRLVEEDLFVTGPAVALVVTLARDDGEPLGDKDRLALAVGLDHGRRRLPARQSIQLQRPDHGLLVVAHPGRAGRRDLAELGAAVHERVLADGGYLPAECRVGIGERRTALSDIHDSYREACRAAAVARVIRLLGPVVDSSDLGVYGLLAELPTPSLEQSLHPGLRSLLELSADGNDTLVATLEAFLDNAGDVKLTADRLCLHRASLYYRLRRIESVAQVARRFLDTQSGAARDRARPPGRPGRRRRPAGAAPGPQGRPADQPPVAVRFCQVSQSRAPGFDRRRWYRPRSDPQTPSTSVRPDTTRWMRMTHRTNIAIHGQAAGVGLVIRNGVVVENHR